MRNQKWERVDTYFVLALIAGAFLLEFLFGSDANAGKYYYTPPATPLQITYTLKVNGVEVQASNSACPPPALKTELEPVDFTACPKGYLCKPDAKKGMRTLRIEEERRYKKLLEVWNEEKFSTSSGGK